MLFLVCLFFSCQVVSSVGQLSGCYWVPLSSHVRTISFVCFFFLTMVLHLLFLRRSLLLILLGQKNLSILRKQLLWKTSHFNYAPALGPIQENWFHIAVVEVYLGFQTVFTRLPDGLIWRMLHALLKTWPWCLCLLHCLYKSCMPFNKRLKTNQNFWSVIYSE